MRRLTSGPCIFSRVHSHVATLVLTVGSLKTELRILFPRRLCVLCELGARYPCVSRKGRGGCQGKRRKGGNADSQASEIWRDSDFQSLCVLCELCARYGFLFRAKDAEAAKHIYSEVGFRSSKAPLTTLSKLYLAQLLPRPSHFECPRCTAPNWRVPDNSRKHVPSR